METTETVRERLETLENQAQTFAKQIRAAEWRLHCWRGIAYGLLIVGLYRELKLMSILRNISTVMSSGVVLIILAMFNIPSAKANDIYQLEFTARNDRDGAIISGRIVYDISVPDSNSDPTVGLYEGAIRRFSTKIINAQNNVAEFVTQTLTISAGGTVLVGLPGDGVGHCGRSIVCLNFISPPGASSELVMIFFPAGSLTTDALPTTVPRNADLLLELNDGSSQFSSGDTKVSVKRLKFFRDDERDDEEDRYNRGRW